VRTGLRPERFALGHCQVFLSPASNSWATLFSGHWPAASRGGRTSAEAAPERFALGHCQVLVQSPRLTPEGSLYFARPSQPRSLRARGVEDS
jgi:hypothetical protein